MTTNEYVQLAEGFNLNSPMGEAALADARIRCEIGESNWSLRGAEMIMESIAEDRPLDGLKAWVGLQSAIMMLLEATFGYDGLSDEAKYIDAIKTGIGMIPVDGIANNCEHDMVQRAALDLLIYNDKIHQIQLHNDYVEAITEDALKVLRTRIETYIMRERKERFTSDQIEAAKEYIVKRDDYLKKLADVRELQKDYNYEVSYIGQVDVVDDEDLELDTDYDGYHPYDSDSLESLIDTVGELEDAIDDLSWAQIHMKEAKEKLYKVLNDSDDFDDIIEYILKPIVVEVTE